MKQQEMFIPEKVVVEGKTEDNVEQVLSSEEYLKIAKKCAESFERIYKKDE